MLIHLLEKFKDGEKRYQTDPRFRITIDCLIRGDSVYELLDDTLLSFTELSKRFENHLLSPFKNDEILYTLYNVNYTISETPFLIGYFTDKDKIHQYIEQEWKRISPVFIFNNGKLIPTDEKHFYERYEYTSHNGQYNCAYELKPIQFNLNTKTIIS